jgi:hypothetical protein
MADKALLGDNVAINIPLGSTDETASKIDELPPAYEYPKIDFSSGWKDRGFAIVFYIHTIAVIITGSVLGYLMMRPDVTKNAAEMQEDAQVDSKVKLLLFPLGGAAAASGLVSFATFFLLQLCAGRLIVCSLILVIIVEIVTGVLLLLLVHWGACIPSFILLFITLLFICCVRKRIPFAEVHLRVGCAVLRKYPSLILVTLVLFVVEVLWLIFWCLMVAGILHASGHSFSTVNNNTAVSTTRNYMNYSSTFAMYDRRFTPTTTSAYMVDRKPTRLRTSTYRTNTATNRIARSVNRYNTKEDSSNNEKSLSRRIVTSIISFALLLSWYWGAVTFANVAHFVTACAVGRWWFTGDAAQQYTTGTSLKRAITTNFGTIAFGSLLEAIIKALRSNSEGSNNKGLFACFAQFILRMLEKIIGYMNDWAFIYSALTGQSFLQASLSFIELFKKRGWTMVINDALIGYCLAIINFLVGIVSATVSGLITYVILRNSPLESINIYIISIMAIFGFIIGTLLSTIMTTILSSCVRTVFVCFALNPAALGATHPEHLKRLTDVWHEFRPQEFAGSGYDQHLLKPDSAFTA